MNRLIVVLVIILAAASIAIGQVDEEFGATIDQIDNKDSVLLKNGTILHGDLIEQQQDFVVFETEMLGQIKIPRNNIEQIAENGVKIGVIIDPDENTIMFCPTPATMPEGDSYFRNYELIFLNFGFGVTDNFDLSVGTLFPISGEFQMISVGGKLRLVDRNRSSFGLALTGSYTKLEDIHFGAFGYVVGIGDAKKSLNLAINHTFENGNNNETVIIVGGDIQVSNRGKLFAEYLSSSSLLENEGSDLTGFVNIGLRLFGEKHSFSISGFRPLGLDNDRFIAFPMVMYSGHW